MPNSGWYLNSTGTELTCDDLAQPLTGNYILQPYPAFYWYVSNNTLRHRDLPSPLTGNYISQPYPAFYWYIDRGKITNRGLHELTPFGTCYNATKLTEIEIPQSVKFISDYAFYHTLIKIVTIATDCEYCEHSFPEGTVIMRYLT